MKNKDNFRSKNLSATVKLTTVLAVVLAAAGLMLNQPARAAVDTCTWTGNGIGSSWSDGENWSGCDNGGVPEADDNLVFPDGPANKTTFLDINGSTFGSLTISGDDYSITGIASNYDLFVSGEITISGDNTDLNVTTTLYSSDASWKLSNSGTGTAISDTLFLEKLGGVATATLEIENNLSVENIISAEGDPDSIVKTGSGSLIITATGSIYSSDISIQDGTWQCDADSCFGLTGNTVTLEDGGDSDASVIALNGNEINIGNDIVIDSETGDAGVIEATRSATISGDITASTDGVIMTDGFATTLTINGGVSIDDGQTLTYGGSELTDQTGVVSGDGNVIIDGDINFQGANTYTGTTTINSDGELTLRSQGVLGASTGGTIIEDGGSLIVTGVTGDKTYAEPLTISGDGGALGAIYDGDADDDITFSGAITLAGDTTVHNVFDGTTLSLSGVISGTGNLTLGSGTGGEGKYSLGALGGGGLPNTFDGGTTVNGTKVSLSKDGAVPGNLTVQATADHDASVGNIATGDLDTVSDTGVLTLSNNGAHTATFNYGGMSNSETVGGLSGDGIVSMTGALGTFTLTLNVANDTSQTFSGDMTVSILNKDGGGTQVIDDLTADTVNINDGYLIINGETNADIVVDAGSVLKGHGELGDTSVAGTLAPGESPGCLTLANLTLSGTYDVEIDGDTVCNEYDRTTVPGTVTINNTTLNLDPTYTPAIGTVFTIIDASAITGTFDGLPDGSTFTVNGLTFRINYSNEVTLTFLGGEVTVPSGTPDTGLAHTDMRVFAAALLVGSVLLLSQIAIVRRFVYGLFKKAS